MSKNPTLRDIAKLADVSLSTVSLVLNNKASVTPEMRERVLEVAQRLGYRQKIVSSLPVVSKLNTVGLLTKRHQDDQMIVNPFYSHIIAGVERECQRNQVNLMYANVEVDEHNHPLNWPSMLLNQLVDGVIMVGTFIEEALADISRRANSNIILVDSYTSTDNLFDTVVIDNVGGANQAVTYLSEMGHRHIGLIGSNPNAYPSVKERRMGYLMSLAQRNLPSYIEDGLLDRADAFEATIRLLRRHPQITAIFACNDNTAMGVLNAVRHLELRVPEDISVIGFDDIDLAQEVMPPLTTVHVDKVLMGAMALRILRDRVMDDERAAIKTIVTTQLIVRDSVCRLED